MVNAPSTPGWYEFDGVSTHTPITLLGEIQGDGTVKELVTVGQVIPPKAPTAPTNLRLVSVTSTTASVRWDEVADPQVARHQIYIGGVAYGPALAGNALSDLIINLTPNTSYPRVTVRRANAFGESPDSNVIPITTDPAQAGVPTAPDTFTITGITASGALANWTELADASVTSHQLYLDGAKYGRALTAADRSEPISGLAELSPHSAFVTRSNASGESAPSPVKQFTTLPSSSGGSSPYLYGVSNSNYSHPGTWQVLRVYGFNAVADAIAAGAGTIALSDDDLIKKSGGQASANAFRTALTSLFNKYPKLKVYYCDGNELDRKGPASAGESGTWTTFGQTFALLREVADEFVAQGYFLKMGVDLTQNHVRNDPAVEQSIKDACLQYLDFIACSMYPPGRLKTPLQYTDFQVFIDPVFQQALDWGINEVHCWEIGIETDTNTTHPSNTNETATSVKVRILGHSTLTTITVSSIKQVRPTYAAYMARYIADMAHSLGMPAPHLCWWDSAGDADNRFQTDPAGTSPTTLEAWKNWPTYATAN